MSMIFRQLDRCREDRTILYTALGLCFWGSLTLGALLVSALAASGW